MKGCRQFKDVFIEYLFEEIEKEKKIILENHLARCSKCTSELAEMKQTLEMMGQRERVKPPEEYWDAYWAKLSSRMEKELAPKVRVKAGIWEKVKEVLPSLPSPAYRWAAVASVLVIGILVGRYFLSPRGAQESQMTERPYRSEKGAYAQTVDYRAERYLEKSKIFLLGFVNTNGELEEGEFDVLHQREISQDLIQEASYLKENLREHPQQRLKALIEELETILIEIANLEEQEDLPDIDLIRDGIDRKGILLKINVHQMGDGLEKEKVERKEKDRTLI